MTEQGSCKDLSRLWPHPLHRTLIMVHNLIYNRDSKCLCLNFAFTTKNRNIYTNALCWKRTCLHTGTPIGSFPHLPSDNTGFSWWATLRQDVDDALWRRHVFATYNSVKLKNKNVLEGRCSYKGASLRQEYFLPPDTTRNSLTGLEVKGTKACWEGGTSVLSVVPRVGELCVNSRTEMTLINRCIRVVSTRWIYANQ